jgi:hypothetical protein
MSAAIIDGPRPNIVTIYEMRIGQIGTFKYGNETILALRTYDGMVDLNRPGRTWDDTVTFNIELFPDGTRVELVSEAQ